MKADGEVMEFTFETTYNQKAVTAMAKTLRKTIRKKRSRRAHVLGWIVIALALLFTLPLGENEFTFDIRTVITWLAGIIILMVLLFEDSINGYIARKRMLAGTRQGTTIFQDETFTTTTEIGKTEFIYDKINLLAETDSYFVFVYDKSHAQVYDKGRLSGGTVEEYRKFIAEKTGKEITKIKAK